MNLGCRKKRMKVNPTFLLTMPLGFNLKGVDYRRCGGKDEPPHIGIIGTHETKGTLYVIGGDPVCLRFQRDEVEKGELAESASWEQVMQWYSEGTFKFVKDDKGSEHEEQLFWYEGDYEIFYNNGETSDSDGSYE